MNDTFYSIKRVLDHCVGRDRAMTLAAIADTIGISRREVEKTIETDLERFPFAVVSSACGVFQPTDPQDLNQYLHTLHTRHRRMQVREATVRRKARCTGWVEEAGSFVRAPQATQMELIS